MLLLVTLSCALELNEMLFNQSAIILIDIWPITSLETDTSFGFSAAADQAGRVSWPAHCSLSSHARLWVTSCQDSQAWGERGVAQCTVLTDKSYLLVSQCEQSVRARSCHCEYIQGVQFVFVLCITVLCSVWLWPRQHPVASSGVIRTHWWRSLSNSLNIFWPSHFLKVSEIGTIKPIIEK